MPEARTFADEERRGWRQKTASRPFPSSGNRRGRAGRSACSSVWRRCAEVDDNQPQEHAGDGDVDRHPGTDAEQEQGHQRHDDRDQQGQMDRPPRACTTGGAVLTATASL